MYYQGSSDGLQTLYLMNPNYLAYNTTPHAPHAPLPQQQFMGIPLSHDPSRPSPSQEDHHHIHYNLWGLADHQSAFGDLNNQPNTPQQQPTPRALSLSLTPTQINNNNNNNNHGRIISSNFITTTDDDDGDGDMKSLIMGSKYLKAAQELLDEVVSVGKGPTTTEGSKDKAKKESVRESDERVDKNGGPHELTTAQRQEIQMKKTKLNSMLDEVEQRYKQYHHQMQIMVTSFQQVAGNGSAKSYTQLALKTILKQFRCLKNTISSQIKALCKSLGEEENPGQKMDGSRLKLVDHDHFRQQRALQQLGIMQNNNSAWRPQRGFPERAVSVLRAWLFEHFLHPYPKDSDKHTLAKQTGLTRSQVSNWFINARVRLWKPMVEDMYLEEIKNQETIRDGPGAGLHTESNSKPSNPQQANDITCTPTINNLNTLQSVQNNTPTLNLVPPPSEISASTVTTKSLTRNNIENPNKNNPKKPRKDNSPRSMLSVDMERDQTFISKGLNENIMFTNANQNMESYLSSSGFSSRYGISVGESERQQIPSGFQGNNINNNNNNNYNFSLTLALPPSGNYSQGAPQQNFLPHFGTRIEPVESNDRVNGINNNRSDGSHPNIGNYEILDFQNRKPFSSQLLPDHRFVA
ncbi:bel1-like homeodomain protein 1 [Phtheirospermum japonicum]|uniref:Bel1-like homeodomain protein 1 n=1 Tax=Phtheirospermum japonicum TaxID=374723 RepID=A0A830CLV0_9LAMI|nr:bel1-like homeodomain protein 1 [Phtheirospermum japonicum]